MLRARPDIGGRLEVGTDTLLPERPWLEDSIPIGPP